MTRCTWEELGAAADTGQATGVLTCSMSVVAFVGDIHGHFEEASVWLARAVKAHGPVDAVVAVGDVQANRHEADVEATLQPRKYRVLGDFARVLAGELQFPAPVLFIGGNHEPWSALDALGSGEWAPSWHFLGRAGTAEVAGVRIAFLSGVAPSGAPIPSRTKLAARGEIYFAAEDVSTIRKAVRRNRIDLLVTHDWPSGLVPMFRGHVVGSDALRQLVEDVRPSLHVAGHVHLPHRAWIGPTRFAALDKVGWDNPGCVAVFELGDGEIKELEP